MLSFTENSQELLFHYTTRDAALGGILPSRKFRFSSFEDMRDPYENKDWSLPGASNVDALNDPEGEAANRRYFEVQAIANDVKRQARLAGFCMSGRVDRNTCDHGWSRASMWEHYGESHRGVCLVFDREKLISSTLESLHSAELPKPYYKPVLYELDFRYNPMIEINREVVDMNSEQLRAFMFQFVEDHNEHLFYRKATDWSTEMEFRFVVTVPDGFSSPIEVDVQDALVGLVAGERFPDWAVPGTLEITRNLEITAKQIVWTGHDTYLTDLEQSIEWTD